MKSRLFFENQIMNNIRINLTFLFIIIIKLSFADSLTGRINNVDHLSLYYISNFITGEKTVVAQSDVDSIGNYNFEFDSDEIRTYYVDLGAQIARIVITPGQNLVLDLPDYVPMRQSEYLNPYFEKNTVLLYDNNLKGINYDVMHIEQVWNSQLKDIINNSTPSHSAKKAINTLQQIDLENNNLYTQNYLKYSQAVFYKLEHPEYLQGVKRQYLRNTEPELQNPQFTNLFISEYNNPFINTDATFYPPVKEAIINNHLSTDFIKDIATLLKIDNTKMAELVAIKGFYDAALYVPNYEQKITLLMQQLEEKIQHQDLKELCCSTRKKLEKLMVGNPAPYYELYTLNGKKVPTVLKRKNVLLAFINTNIFECRKQLYLLEKVKDTYKKNIEIVVVATYQDKEELERFLNRNSFKNIYFTLWENNQNLIEDYEIKTLPSYFLIDKDGNIVYAPLSSPEENLFEELQETLK